MVSPHTVQYIRGDILSSLDQFVIHGCNAQGVMGSGVARALREEYPMIFEPYRRFMDAKASSGDQGRSALGEAVIVKVSADKTIGNLITQQFYGRDPGRRYVSYDAVDLSLRVFAQRTKASRISMPLIGAGLGGGRWEIIRKIIELAASDYGFVPRVWINEDALYRSLTS